MTNMGRLLKLLPNGNCYVQDIATEAIDCDKVFSISRKRTNAPMIIDFLELKKAGFEPLKMGWFDSNVDEIIIKYVR